MGSWLSKTGALWGRSGPRIQICLVEIGPLLSMRFSWEGEKMKMPQRGNEVARSFKELEK